MTVVFRRAIAKMEGYVPGEQPRDAGWIKLNTNENPYPPSPAVAKAVAAESKKLRLYPDPAATALRAQASAAYGFGIDGIVAGNGSDDLLAMIVRAFVGEGDALTCATPTYTLYDTLVAIQGGRMTTVPYPDDYSLPVAALARKRAPVTIVANPNSPSGTTVPVDVLADLADRVAGILVVDEAYADFSEDNALRLAKTRENVVVLRTFSKSFSLAGMRIGLGFCHPIVAEGLNKVKDSYNMSRPAIAAGAAALSDLPWMEKNARKIKKTRARLVAELPKVGFLPFPSSANFVLARSADGKSARSVHETLKAKKILVRYFDTPRLGDSLRITVGTDAEVDALLSAMRRL